MAEALNEKKHNEAQEFLRQIELCDTHISNKLEELDRLNDLARKITTSLSMAPAHGSGNQDKLGNAVAKIVDLEREINAEIDHYVDKKTEVKRVLEKIKNPDQLKVLSKHYLLFETLEQIACEMGYSYRNICYIHGRGLQAVSEILKEGMENENYA